MLVVITLRKPIFIRSKQEGGVSFPLKKIQPVRVSDLAYVVICATYSKDYTRETKEEKTGV